MKNLFHILLLSGWLVMLGQRCEGTQQPQLGIWHLDGRAFRALCVADREARGKMDVRWQIDDCKYTIVDTGETFIVTLAPINAPKGQEGVEVRIRKSDFGVIYRVRRASGETYEKFRARQKAEGTDEPRLPDESGGSSSAPAH